MCYKSSQTRLVIVGCGQDQLSEALLSAEVPVAWTAEGKTPRELSDPLITWWQLVTLMFSLHHCREYISKSSHRPYPTWHT